MRTRDRLADRLVRWRGGVRARRDAADRFAVSLLATAALSPLPTALRCGTRTAGAATPSGRPALTLRLTTLVSGELTRLLALLTRGERLRTGLLSAELRTRRTELGTRPAVRRSRAAEASAASATTTASAAAPAPRTVLVAELRRRLDEVSALEPIHPYVFFNPAMQGMISGGTSVQPWAPARVYAPPSQEPVGVKVQAARK